MSWGPFSKSWKCPFRAILLRILRACAGDSDASRLQLQAEFQRYQTVADNTYDWESWLAPDGTWLYASPSCKRLTGHPPEDFLNEASLLESLIHPEDREVWRGHVQWIAQSRAPGRVEFRLQGTEGEERWMEVASQPVLDAQGRYAGLRASARDITRRRKAEQALEELERRYEAIVEDQSELICRFLPDGTLTFVNGAYCRYFGKTKEELMGVSFLSLIPETERTRCFQHLDAVKKARQPLVVEHQVTMADGTLRWQRWTDRPIFDEQGRLVEIQSVGQDVTERWELERRVQEISEWERRRLGQELHDGLGQYLTGVTYKGAALQFQLEELGLSQQADLAEELVQMTNRAVRQTRNLSALLLPVAIERDGLVFALEEMASQATCERHVKCSFTSEGGVEGLEFSSAVHLYRIAQESTHNAIQHGEALNVWIDLRLEEGKLSLVIRDDGVGFHPEDKPDGGLGLSIMQYRARMMGGVLTVESAPEKGTVVRCELSVPQGGST